MNAPIIPTLRPPKPTLCFDRSREPSLGSATRPALQSPIGAFDHYELRPATKRVFTFDPMQVAEQGNRLLNNSRGGHVVRRPPQSAISTTKRMVNDEEDLACEASPILENISRSRLRLPEIVVRGPPSLSKRYGLPPIQSHKNFDSSNGGAYLLREPMEPLIPKTPAFGKGCVAAFRGQRDSDESTKVRSSNESNGKFGFTLYSNSPEMTNNSGVTTATNVSSVRGNNEDGFASGKRLVFKKSESEAVMRVDPTISSELEPGELLTTAKFQDPE